MNTKELAEKVAAEESLLKRGYEKQTCRKCKGIGQQLIKTSHGISPSFCYSCDGNGFIWVAPMTR